MRPWGGFTPRACHEPRAAVEGGGIIRAVFLALSKVLDWLAAPLTWALLLLLAAALLRRRVRTARTLAALGAASLVLFSSGPVANGLDRLVERGARATYRPDVVYDAVVVLGGMVDEDASRARGATELDGKADRLVRAYELMRAGRARAVLVSGGIVSPQPGDVPEADRLAAKLVEWGIPPWQVVVEASSRNTRENAIESSRVAAARGWRTLLLVTSAAHVPRALGCFRAVGLEPDVLPVDFRAGDGRGLGWLPRAGALGRSTDALREMLGRAVYRAAGYAR
jgi:uncharacterized SAM-binding protein YcdF (DUF218 family)